MIHSRSEIFAKAISKTSCQSNKRNFMPLPLRPSPLSHIDFKHKFRNNKRVPNSFLRGIEHRPLFLGPAVIATTLLIHYRRGIVMFTYIKLQVLE